MSGSFRKLRRALEAGEVFDECVVYMDLFWGLHPSSHGFAARVKFAVPFCAITFTFFLCLLLPVMEWKGVESLGESDLLSPMYQVGHTFFTIFGFLLQVIFTYLAYRTRQKALSKILSKVESFWSVEMYDDENFRAEIKAINLILRRIFMLYRIAIVGVIAYYTFTPLLIGRRVLIVKWYSFCDLENLLCYGVSIAIQSYVMFLVMFLLTCDGIYLSVIIKTYCQLKMVKYNFENLIADDGEDSDGEKILKEMTVYVEHHALVLDFVNELRKFYSPVLLSQLISCTYTLCIGSFLLTIDGIPPPLGRLLKFIYYIISIVSQIAIYCVAGQILLDECFSVAGSVYATEWWAKAPTVRKSLALVILRAQRTDHLSVGGIATLDVQVFVYVAKTAFSFYTVMNQLYEKKKN